MKKSTQKTMIRCVLVLIFISWGAIVNAKVTEAVSNERAFIETVKAFQIDSYVNSKPTGTKYTYKDIRFTNTFWLKEKKFYKTVWHGILAFDHHYQFIYGTK
ncbi:MAG: hypothetical protein ACRDAU_05140 [Clostridium sp.]